jgi:hypothetical protein
MHESERGRTGSQLGGELAFEKELWPCSKTERKREREMGE